jgi:hypothetical protein
MTAESPKHVLGRVVKTCLVFVVLAVDADAARIDRYTQTVAFHFAGHGTTFDFYQPFDQSLGTLKDVAISVVGSGLETGIDYTNTSANTVTFNGSVGISIFTDAGSLGFVNKFSATLAPGDTLFNVGVSGSFDISH